MWRDDGAHCAACVGLPRQWHHYHHHDGDGTSWEDDPRAGDSASTLEPRWLRGLHDAVAQGRELRPIGLPGGASRAVWWSHQSHLGPHGGRLVNPHHDNWLQHWRRPATNILSK
jgi:hypothetical protein